MQQGDIVLFLTPMPVPHAKPQLRWCIGAVRSVVNKFVYVVDNCNVEHVDYVEKVELIKHTVSCEPCDEQNCTIQ